MVDLAGCASMTFKAADDRRAFQTTDRWRAFWQVPRRYPASEHDNPGRINALGIRCTRNALCVANTPSCEHGGSQIKSWGMRLMRTMQAIGGDNEAPPGYFGRAAVCSCLATELR
jgi:hypothetical protein